jgi:hypothetical protein
MFQHIVLFFVVLQLDLLFLKDSSSKLDNERKKCSLLQDDLIVKEYVDKSRLYGIQDRVDSILWSL